MSEETTTSTGPRFGTHLTVRLSPDHRARLDRLAAITGRTVADIVREALEKILPKLEKSALN